MFFNQIIKFGAHVPTTPWSEQNSVLESGHVVYNTMPNFILIGVYRRPFGPEKLPLNCQNRDYLQKFQVGGSYIIPFPDLGQMYLAGHSRPTI